MIDKGKCNAWSDMLLAIIKMTRELTDEEYEYIKAKLYMKYGKMKLNELEENYNHIPIID